MKSRLDIGKTALIYGATVAAVAAAIVVRWLIDPVLGDHLPYPTFFIAVAIAAWLGGMRPAFLATALGLLAIAFLFVPPRMSVLVAAGPHALGVTMYLVVCFVLAGFGEVMRRSQRQLAERGERLRTTLASIGDAVITTDTDGRIANINAVAEFLTGWTNIEAVGQPLDTVFRIVNETTRKSVENPAFRALRDNVIVGLANHTILIAKDGTERSIDDSAAPIRQKEGEVIGCVLTFRDIGEQRKLQRQASLLASIVLSSEDAIISISLDGIIQSWNAAAERIFGYSASAAIGRSMSIVIPGDRASEEAQILAQLRMGQRIEHFDTVWARIGGDPIHVSLTISPLRDESGEIVGASNIVRDITDRKQAQSKIDEARSRLESTLAASEIGTWEFDIAKNMVWADQNLARMFNVDPDEANGGPLEVFTKAIHPRDADRVADTIRQAIQNGNSFESQYRLVGTGGHIRWVVARGRIQRNLEGKALRLPGVVMDVTRQKSIENELRASEERRKLAVESAELGEWHVNPENMSLTTDQRFREIFGVQSDFLNYQQAVDRIHSDDRSTVERAVEAATSPERPASYAVEYRIVRADGSFRWVFAKGRANFEGEKLTSFDGTLADITERKRSEELTKESERRLRFILDSMPQKVFTATAEGTADYFNPLWIQFSGQTFEQIRGWGWTELVHPNETTQTITTWKRAVETGEAFQAEHRFRRADGVYRWHVSRATALKDESGKIQMWVGATTDIDEQRQTADELRDVAAKLSEAGHRKDEFLATLAHELRNPLAPLRNGLQVLKLAKDDAEAVEQSRTMMERQLNQMVRLVDDLMDVSRISRGKLDLQIQRVELADVLRSAVETSRPLLDQMGQELTVAVPEQPIWIDADFIRLAQVFSNLLNNAAKYSNAGGHIRLTVECQDDSVVVKLKDTGIGIAADQMLRIFELFSQVDRSLEKSQGGLGIGLTLVRRLVEMQGGSVTAHSEGSGKGSEFLVRLPVAVEKPISPSHHGRDEDTHHKSSLRILIVDDNQDSANSLSMMLKFMGNDTRTAYDGEEAVSAANSFRPNVILLDIGLPKMNGYEACRRIREQPWGREIVIIAQTGWGQDEDRRRTNDAGFDHHKVKPVDPISLMKLLSDISPPNNGE